MELLEYYYLIRQRIWIVILGISTALAVVLVYQLLPPAERQATGRLQVYEGGNDVLVYRAGELAARPAENFWRSFETLIESREILDGAATRAGLTGPEIRARLKPLQAEQPSPGNLMDVTAGAPTAEQARALTQAAMEYVSEYWNLQRIANAEQMRGAIVGLRGEQVQRLSDAQKHVDEVRGKGLSPTQELARAEGDLAVSTSQIDTAQEAVVVAGDRLRATEEIVAAEAARPPEQRAFGAAAGNPLRAQILNLRVQLASTLARRTPEHPEVKDLQAQIKQLESALGESAQGTEGAPTAPPVLSREVLDARLALDEAKARLAQLQQRADALRSSLPALRKQAAEFGDADLNVTQAKQAVEMMDAQSATVDREIARLRAQLRVPPKATGETSRDVVIVDDARVLPSPKTWPRFFLFVCVAILGGGILSSVVILGLHYTSVVFTNEVEAGAMLRARILGAIPRSDLPAEQAGPPLQVR